MAAFASASTQLLFLFVLLTSTVSAQEFQLQDVINTPPEAPVKPYAPPPATVQPPSPPAKPYTPPPSAPAPPVVAPPTPYRPPVKKEDCVPLCEGRCQLHSRKRVCVRACSTCCERCKCVPPGTYGNRQLCGTCWTEMRTHGNRFKCP